MKLRVILITNGAAVTLVIAVMACLLFSRRSEGGPLRKISLKERLPSAEGPWLGSDTPIGATGDLRRKTIEILNFDDYVYRNYRRGSDEVGVYIAYWSAGKISVRDVESHVPDICWRYAGWALTEDGNKFSDSGPFNSIPATHRKFSADGRIVYVAYWHVLEGHVIGPYGTEDTRPWSAMIQDMFRLGFAASGEQYFVRISSNVDLRQLSGDPSVRKLIDAAIDISGLEIMI